MRAAEPAHNPLAAYTRFQYRAHISRGAFGLVLCYFDASTQENVAIKFIKREPGCLGKHVEREIVNHSLLSHPHIIGFRECFLTQEYLAISTEYAAGGDLFKYVNSQQGLSEDVARWFFQQLVLALDYMHRMGVVNRDMKLENTLLDRRGDDALIKICDFGYSINENTSLPRSAVGTPGYTAPEVLRSHTRTYNGKPADVWSCGVMLYAMLFCSYPFDCPASARGTNLDAGPGTPAEPHDPECSSGEQNNMEMMQRIIRADYVLPPHKPVSAECADLISRLLTLEPNNRITIAGIQQHRWYLHNLPFTPGEDVNRQYVGDSTTAPAGVAARAASIKQAVRSALQLQQRDSSSGRGAASSSGGATLP